MEAIKLTDAGIASQVKPINLVPGNTGEKAQTVQVAKPAQSQPELKLSKDELTNITAELSKFMESMNTDLQFAVHEKTHRLMVRIIDTKNNKVLKEFPPHELLDTLAAISDYVGALLDKKA